MKEETFKLYLCMSQLKKILVQENLKYTPTILSAHLKITKIYHAL